MCLLIIAPTYYNSVACTSDEDLRKRVTSVLFKPLLNQMKKCREPSKTRWKLLQQQLADQLQLATKADTESSASSDEYQEETLKELWIIWSSFVSINSADSARTKMRFEHFYLLLFLLGLVASPDLNNRYSLLLPVWHKLRAVSAVAAPLQILRC